MDAEAGIHSPEWQGSAQHLEASARGGKVRTGGPGARGLFGATYWRARGACGAGASAAAHTKGLGFMSTTMSTDPPPSPPSPPAYAQGSKDDSWRTPVQPGAAQHYEAAWRTQVQPEDAQHYQAARGKKARQAQAQALQQAGAAGGAAGGL